MTQEISFYFINVWYVPLYRTKMRHPNEIRTQNQWHESIIYLLPKHYKTQKKTEKKLVDKVAENIQFERSFGSLS